MAELGIDFAVRVGRNVVQHRLVPVGPVVVISGPAARGVGAAEEMGERVGDAMGVVERPVVLV